MKKTIIKYFTISICLLGAVSCSNENSTQNQEALVNDDELENDEIQEVSEFEVINISKSEFQDKGMYELQFELKNNTDNIFTSAHLSAKMKYVLSDGETCDDVVQASDIKVIMDKKWSPNTTIKCSLISPDQDYRWSCRMFYERTPDILELQLSLRAISVDREVDNEIIQTFDLLPLWKEKQKELGLR